MTSPGPSATTDPDMLDVYPSFQFNTTSQKRKRRPEDLDEACFSRSIKRRSTQNLPIRSSPSRRQGSSQPAYSLFTSIYQQPPTPVDTSDDESPQQPKDRDPWTRKNPDFEDDQTSSDSSAASLQAQHGDSNDIDMELSENLLPKPTIRRARSNDIIPPHRSSSFLGAMDTFVRERVPTPITSHFDNRLSDLPSVPRHQFPPLRTTLSPMIEQESWIHRDGLPSPIEDQDMDSVMMMDEANNGMGGLTVSGAASPRTQILDSAGLQNDGSLSPGRSRTGRLHMGFLVGCEKCIQKVPGHYSHILWS